MKLSLIVTSRVFLSLIRLLIFYMKLSIYQYQVIVELNDIQVSFIYLKRGSDFITDISPISERGLAMVLKCSHLNMRLEAYRNLNFFNLSYITYQILSTYTFILVYYVGVFIYIVLFLIDIQLANIWSVRSKSKYIYKLLVAQNYLITSEIPSKVPLVTLLPIDIIIGNSSTILVFVIV